MKMDGIAIATLLPPSTSLNGIMCSLTMLSPSTDTWIVDQQFRSALDSGIGNSQASKLPWSSRGQAKADPSSRVGVW